MDLGGGQHPDTPASSQADTGGSQPALALLSEGGWAALTAIRTALPHTTGDHQAITLTVELLARALRDPALGADLREQTRLARTRIADRLAELHPDWTRERCVGTTMVAMSTIDGLALHLMLDPRAPGTEALDALEDMISALGGRS